MENILIFLFSFHFVQKFKVSKSFLDSLKSFEVSKKFFFSKRVKQNIFKTVILSFLEFKTIL